MTFTEDLQGFGVALRDAKKIANDRQRWKNRRPIFVPAGIGGTKPKSKQLTR